jgi:hypothetical protein
MRRSPVRRTAGRHGDLDAGTCLDVGIEQFGRRVAGGDSRLAQQFVLLSGNTVRL